MKNMKHILWPAVLLLATATVGFAENNSYGKYDRCHDKYEHGDKCHRDHDKHCHDKDKDRDHDKYGHDRDGKDQREQPLNSTDSSSNNS